jgi:hypothetical protein
MSTITVNLDRNKLLKLFYTKGAPPIVSAEAYLLGDKTTGVIYLKHKGVLRWIDSMATFDKLGFALAGVNWQTTVAGTRGDDIHYETPLPEPLLMYDWGTPYVSTGAIYYWCGGKRYWIKDMTIFAGYGFKTEWLVMFTNPGVEQYSRAEDLTGQPLPC